MYSAVYTWLAKPIEYQDAAKYEDEPGWRDLIFGLEVF
jgi:hypothetical protein